MPSDWLFSNNNQSNRIISSPQTDVRPVVVATVRGRIVSNVGVAGASGMALRVPAL